jgi:hypothetical protein
MLRLAVLCLVFIAFTGWSTLVSIENGYWGFIDVALAGDWQSQVFIDLCIGLTIALGGMKKDARQQGITFWPYLVATPFLGSISPLAYLIHRQVKKLRQQDAAS